MKKFSILFLLCALFPFYASAQQNLFAAQDITSAEVDDNHCVTFRFIAPNAKKVQVAGDFLEKAERNPVGGIVGTGLADMVKDTAGVWTYTSKPLPSELYSYLIVVDGVPTTDPNNVYVYRDFATVSNVFIVGGGKADLYKVNAVPHGTVEARWYHSDAFGYDRRLNVYTPAGYEDHLDRKYPVLYLLHGSGGDENEWVTFGRAIQILDNLIAQGKAVPMIVAMPNGHPAMEAAPGESSWGYYKPYHVKSLGPNAFENAFPEIMNFVESNYRVQADKAHRAIAGLSMGGGHSLKISMMYPDKFDYVGLFSAAYGYRFGEKTQPADPFAPIRDQLKEQFRQGVKLYWIGCGNQDFLFPNVTAYRHELDNDGFKYTYMETGDGHVWKNWRIYLQNYLPLLFR